MIQMPQVEPMYPAFQGTLFMAITQVLGAPLVTYTKMANIQPFSIPPVSMASVLQI